MEISESNSRRKEMLDFILAKVKSESFFVIDI